VSTAVHVQHLPGHVTRFRQINDRIRNVLQVYFSISRAESQNLPISLEKFALRQFTAS
jgi:hypothetical protein